jgi:hypothetical protein
VVQLEVLASVGHRLVAEVAPHLAAGLGHVQLAAVVLTSFARGDGAIAIVTESSARVAGIGLGSISPPFVVADVALQVNLTFDGFVVAVIVVAAAMPVVFAVVIAPTATPIVIAVVVTSTVTSIVVAVVVATASTAALFVAEIIVTAIASALQPTAVVVAADIDTFVPSLAVVVDITFVGTAGVVFKDRRPASVK